MASAATGRRPDAAEAPLQGGEGGASQPGADGPGVRIAILQRAAAQGHGGDGDIPRCAGREAFATVARPAFEHSGG
jgi:hypothetical protein